MIRAKPFLVFALIVTALVAGGLRFIQGPRFAAVARGVIARQIPREFGVDAEFSELSISVFPPGLSLRNPRVTVRERNALGLPGGSSLRAERIHLTFHPLQMLSGHFRIHELAILHGDAHLIQVARTMARGRSGHAPSPVSGKRVAIRWEDVLHLPVDSILMRDIRLRLDRIEGNGVRSAELELHAFHLEPWRDKSGAGYALLVDVQRYSGALFPRWAGLASEDRVILKAHVKASGAVIDSLSILGRDHQASVSGRIQGNPLNRGSPLWLDCEIRAQGGLAPLVAALPAAPDLEGRADFQGRVRADLRKAIQTLDVQGRVDLEGFRYRLFQADQLLVSGRWRALPQGGELSIASGEVSSHEIRRSPGQLARGGRVTVAPFRLVLGSGQAVPLHLRLERARLQWLAALGIRRLKQIYAVDFAASGPVDVTLTPPWGQKGVAHPLRISAVPRLDLEEFQLDNQRPGEQRALHRIFAVPRIRVEGPIDVGAEGIRSDGVRVAIGQTQLTLSGTIGNEAEYDLRAGGAIRLDELGQLADNAIRGDGKVEVAIHGPAKKLLVDIDLDVKDAYYLHLNLGNVTGRLTWDDDPDHLLFQKIRVTQGATLVSLDGMLRLGKLNQADLKASIAQGEIHDFAGIFSELTRNLPWFPNTLSGPFTGDLTVSGGLNLDELRVDAHFEGRDWEYLGERLDRLALQGGYDRGRFQLSDFSIRKHQGRLAGHISHDKDGTFDWDLHEAGLGLGDLGPIARLDVPIRGKLQVDSAGHGKDGAIQAESSIRVTELTVRGVSMGDSSLIIGSAKGVHSVHGSALGAQGTLDMDYDSNPARTSQLHARFQRLDFSPILLLLNPKSIPDPNLEGFLSGSLDLAFRAGQIDRASGVAALTDYRISQSGVRFRLERPVTVRLADGSFDLPDLSLLGFSGSRRSKATLSLTGTNGQLKGQLSGNVDLAALQVVTPVVGRATGPARLQFAIGGTVRAPTLAGQAELSEATLWARGLESPFEHMTGDIELNQGAITIRSLESELAGARFAVTGDILLFPDQYPKISLRGNFYGNRLKVFPFQYIKIRGPVTIHGEGIPYAIDGDLVVDSALSRENVLQRKQSAGPKAARYMPPESHQQGAALPLFKLHVNVRADNGVRVQDDLFDAELKARLALVNTLENPGIVGTIELVQGKMIFKDRSFQLQQASVVFGNAGVINPRINLNGGTEIDGVKVRLFVAGTVEKPQINLTSTPVMSETDILNLLALGMTSTDTQRLSPMDRAMLEQGEAASLLLNSLDFNREVESKTGIKLQLDETVNNLIGASAFRPQAATETAAAPRIVIKKQITNNVNVTYGSTVGVGTSSDQEVNTEVRMTPGMSVIGVWDNYEALDTQDRLTSYGLDLKFQKRFR